MKYLLPILAIIGLGIAVVTVIVDHRPVTNPPSLVPALAPPYPNYVAGDGIVEAGTQNIAVGTSVPGIVTDILVKWGDRARAGDPLFKIDDRDAQARLVSARAAVEKAKLVLAKSEYERELAEILGAKAMIGREELTLRRQERAIDQAALEVAQALVEEVKVEIERRTVRAPVAGRILRIDIRLGEYASSDPLAATPILMGDDEKLEVRIEIDEQDAWRVRPGAKAMAFVRGNAALKIPLDFLRLEPYILPKTVLTGNGAERTDARVLQVIYGFDHASWPVYVGQEVDVFIDAPPAMPEVK